MSAMNPTFFKTPSQFICKQWLPAEFPLYQAFPVRVTSIVSPSSFWVQLQGPPYSDLLMLLEYTMNQYYKSVVKTREVFFDSTGEIKDKRYAALLFNKTIRRVRVHRIELIGDDLIATVFHLDYGLITREYCNTLMRLHNDFSFFPQQAIWATLAEIVPANQKLPWNLEDSSKFAYLVQDKELEALLVGVFPKRLKMHLILNDISNFPEQININEKLIELEIAVPGETVNVETLSF